MLSFVVWRQFFMVLAAPGVATALGPIWGLEKSFLVALLVAAAPSLVHGQLWKWTYDWAGSGEPTLRNLRVGQVVMGVAHAALCAWALYRVAMGEIPYQGAAFYYGLSVAGFAAGIWETVRPALEIRPAPASPPPAPSASTDAGAVLTPPVALPFEAEAASAPADAPAAPPSEAPSSEAPSSEAPSSEAPPAPESSPASSET